MGGATATGKRLVGVVGGGPWGVALALAATRAGSDVTLFTRREHPEGDRGLHVTTDLAEVTKARLLFVAVPSKAARSVLRALGDHLDGAHLVVHGVRGLSGDELSTVSDIVREETPARRVGALGGPVQADELTEGRPSAMVCGSCFPEVTAAVAEAMQSDWLRVYKTSDLRGLEWASAMVGCLSIGVGFAKAAGAGPGLLAALIARGMDEAARLASAAGAEEKTLFSLGGYGDLLASIALDDRPEVIVGTALAAGKRLDEAVAEARLRVEAIELVPRLRRFAAEQRIFAPSFDAIGKILEGHGAAEILAELFST